MIYVYDFLVNFNDELYEFYEWEDKDIKEYLKKGILIKTSSFLYKKFISNNIIVSDKFLNNIKNKTEIIRNKKKTIIEYSCIITDGNNNSAYIFNSNGNIIKYSSFTIEDDLELFEIASSINLKKITYKSITNSKYLKSFKTREEKSKINFILTELDKIKNHNLKIQYLYYEWFNKKHVNNNYYDELVNSIQNGYTKKTEEFLNLLNLITINE